jgi:nucleoside-diphosphate-sugar epimerase
VRALVTGAAGFIGSHLCERLWHDHHDLVAVDAITDYYDVRMKRANVERLRRRCGLEVLELDAGDPQVLDRLRDLDVVFHLAAQPGVRRSWDRFPLYLRENVECVHRILAAASTLPHPPRVVLASSSSVYGNAPDYPCLEDSPLRPVSPYGVTKLSMENLAAAYVAAFALPVVNLRYFTVYGPGQRPDMAFHRFIDAALTGQPVPVFGDGQQIREFTYVDDIVDATVRAGCRPLPPGTTMNVCGGDPTTVNAVLTLLGEILERPIEVDRGSFATGDVFRTGGVATRAHDLLGWRPLTPLAVGLAHQLRWQQERSLASGWAQVG